jgi:hypothetical protein
MTYQVQSQHTAAPFTPMRPYDDRAGDEGRDFAASGSFSLYALERMLRDCTEQPHWRLRAKLCAAYYDGKQLDEVRRYMLMQEDLDERVINLIRPIINSVLGQEAKSRTDVRIECDDDSYADVAEVISARLKEAERETNAHMAVSNAYASMVKKGLGWLHVCRNSDPLAYPYRVEDVPLDEVWWDWRGQKGVVLDDRCRWLCRMRMVDLDELIAAMPQHEAVLKRTVAGWDDPRLMTDGALLGEPENPEFAGAFENEMRFNLNWRKFDWVDQARKMVKVVEVWYRVPAMAVCLQLTPTRRIPYNERDPRHVEAVARGLVKIVKGPTSQVRRALYAGPHRLLDEATTRKRFPYIPLFAYRDDDDGSPYGLIDGMIAPQDDYNDRRHRIQWMLKARQLFIDNDALDPKYNSIAEIADNVNRPDLVAVLNGNRANKQGGVKIENTLSLQKEQFLLLDQAELLVQKSAGRYGSNLGEAQVQSGIANQILVDQGEQAMGEMNDNYVTGRRTGFESLVDLIVEDHLEPDLRTTVGQGRNRRTVILNTWQPPMGPAVDPATGQPIAGPDGKPQMVPVGPPVPTNMVADAHIVTGLGEVPNTPAYRSQLRTELGEVIQALNGNAQALAVLTPAYIESTNMDNRQEVADDLRRATGMPLPGDKQGREQAEAAMAQNAQEMAAIEKRKAGAEAEEKMAGARLKDAQAKKTMQEVLRLARGTALGDVDADVEGKALGIEQQRREMNDPNAQADDAVAQAMAGMDS